MSAPRPMGIYAVTMLDRAVKIGITNDAKMRLHGLQTGNPMPLSMPVFMVIENARGAEMAWHRRLRRYRACGEWFIMPPRLRARVVALVAAGWIPAKDMRGRSKPLAALTFHAGDVVIERVNSAPAGVVSLQSGLSALGLPVAIEARFINAGYRTIGEVVSARPKSLLSIPDVGRVTIGILKAHLERHGFEIVLPGYGLARMVA